MPINQSINQCILNVSAGLVSRLMDLISSAETGSYVDLTLGFEGDDDDYEEMPCPPVRYFY